MAIDWAKKLEKIPKPKGDIPDGKDWFTVHELREKSGWSRDKAYSFINKNLNSSKLEVYRGTEYSNDYRQLVRRVWYRFL